MKKNNISLLILSSGGYQDLWIPHFFYLKKYLESDLFDHIYLSTNYYNSTVPKRIEILKSDKEWSDRLIEALEKVNSDFVFIILEDYILQAWRGFEDCKICFCKDALHSLVAHKGPVDIRVLR